MLTSTPQSGQGRRRRTGCEPSGRRAQTFSPLGVAQVLRPVLQEPGVLPPGDDAFNSLRLPWACGSDGLERWKREHPRWPSTTTVRNYSGSWSAAPEAAGLPSQCRPELPLEERIAAARRLAAAGPDARSIADCLGVSSTTARAYRRARPCRSCGALFVGRDAERWRGVPTLRLMAGRGRRTRCWRPWHVDVVEDAGHGWVAGRQPQPPRGAPQRPVARSK